MSSRYGPDPFEQLEQFKRMSAEDIGKNTHAVIIRITGHQQSNTLNTSHYFEQPKLIPLIKPFDKKKLARKKPSHFEAARSIVAYQNLVCKVMVLNLHKQVIDGIQYCKLLLQYKLTSEDFPIAKWEQELERVEQQLINKLPTYFEEGVNILSATTQEILELEKEKLQPLEEFYYNPSEGQPDFVTGLKESLAELQEQIKGDFKNSNRMTYKLMQEFQQQLEEFSEVSSEDQGSKIEEIKQESLKHIEKMKLVAIEIFDMLDLVYQATLKVNETTWSKEIEAAITKIITLLEAHGIAEIPVKGLLVDGKIMEVIGTVSQNDVQVPMQKYEVYAVHQRGFMDKSTGRVLRKASVTSVL
ncbi:nucleotide exchange factor GrpE [Bacillus sinesaloumensis]|uniref:nucleotide exchange factor GrpE n=1 Tax=Litchfieldia sinesaloumensis TaxID=1926280 RepID=UPI000988813B|nr:nucleotide exchange factor GrpE [Bacillus sinesaloumensis]